MTPSVADTPHLFLIFDGLPNFDGEAVKGKSLQPNGHLRGALKFGAEKLVIGYHQVFGLPYTIIRPSALYGERCVSRRVGQAFIENALAGQDLTVNGDGSDALDFTYIQDLIQGDKSGYRTGIEEQVFNITYGGRTLKELAELVLSEFPGIELKYNPRDSLMPERGTLSIEKARRILGYEPISQLKKGLPNYIQWYREFQQAQPQLFKS